MWQRQPMPTIKNALLEFSQVLERGDERSAQVYLEANPSVFSFISDDGAGFIAPQFRLSDKYVTDFAIFSRNRWSNNPCLLCTFVEIEPPSMKLFAKSGDPAAALTHAIRQVQDWKAWVTVNVAFLRDALSLKFATEELTDIESERRSKPSLLAKAVGLGLYHRYLVVGGRRSKLSIPDLLRLAEMNNNLHDIKVVTFDAVLAGWMRIAERSSIFVSWDDVE